MLYGFISKGNSTVSFYIYVEGYPEEGFGGYSLKNAIKKYRTNHGLTHKHIHFFDHR